MFSSVSGTTSSTLLFSGKEWALLGAVIAATVLAGVATHEWLGVIGVGVTLAGLGFAIRQIDLAKDQIGKTLSVAQATRDAMTKSRAELARSEMIALIPRLLLVDRGLASAVRGDESAEIADRLADWRDAVYEFIGLLEGTSYASEALLNDLYETGKAAANFVTDVPDEFEKARVETKQVRAEVSGVCGRLGILHSKLKLSIEEEEDGTAE